MSVLLALQAAPPAPDPVTVPKRLFRPQVAVWRRAAVITLLLGAAAVSGCIDVSATLYAPCSASVVQNVSRDTLYKLTVDTLACPRR